MTVPELNALLNSIEIIVLTILALRVTLLLNARKREIDSLHEELHQKNDLLEVRRQRIDLLERSERLHAAERTEERQRLAAEGVARASERLWPRP